MEREAAFEFRFAIVCQTVSCRRGHVQYPQRALLCHSTVVYSNVRVCQRGLNQNPQSTHWRYNIGPGRDRPPRGRERTRGRRELEATNTELTGFLLLARIRLLSGFFTPHEPPER